MANEKKSVRDMLVDKALPFEHRKMMLIDLCLHESEESTKLLEWFFEAAARGDGKAIYEEKIKQVDELLKELQDGPLRCATFLGMLPRTGAAPRAKVRLEDGTTTYPLVPDEKLAPDLARGARVLLDAAAKAILFLDPVGDSTGEEARLERRVGTGCVEVSLRGDEKAVFDAGQALIDRLDSEEDVIGTQVLVNSRQRIAYDALPKQEGLAHYVYLDRSPVPDVLPERDIGAPPRFIADLETLVRKEMTDPSQRRRYKLRRCQMKLLAGPSGTGKTLSLYGTLNRLYSVMSEVTGVPVEELPPRVMRLRSAEVLSMWLGQSDKNLDRFFTEAEQLASERFVGADGREYELPIIAILEEIDALTRTRGQDAIYDRILTTLLQRLDPTRFELKSRLLLFLATTNVVSQVDPAALRRIGGTIERFSRLNRRSFIAVLQKHTDGLPFATRNGDAPDHAQRRAVRDLVSWLYSHNGQDKGQVELRYANSHIADVRHRRDFLTGGLIDRAVQQACEEACELEDLGCEHPGLTAELLMGALDDQIQAIVERLDPLNVANYLSLPDGAHVTGIRRIQQPSVLPSELMRAS